jgi:hypothetical protein
VNNCTNTVPAGARWKYRLIVLLGLLSTLQAVQAGTPAPYGQAFYRQGASWDDGLVSGQTAAPYSGPAGDEQDYEDQIRQLELSEGPYSDALAEPLSSLAHFYRGQGNYKNALRLYGRALHLVRINDGLYSERQIPVVRSMLDSYREAGDMQGLDKRYDYFFRLYGKGEPPYTDLRMRATVEYLRWQREAFRIELDGDGKGRLMALYELNKKLLEDTVGAVGVGHNWYRALVMSQLRNLYLIQVTIEPPQDVYGNSALRPILTAQDQELDPRAQRMANVRRSSAGKGRALLEELIARTQAVSEATELAAVYLELGDWHQWNDNRQGAKRAYLKVQELLANAEPSLAQKWLGQPIELPANGAFWQSAPLSEEGREVVLSASFDVSERGRPKNIRVAAASEEQRSDAARLRRKLSATRFRPRFVDGMSQEVEQLKRSYTLVVD